MTVFEKWHSMHCQLKLSIRNVNNNTNSGIPTLVYS